MRRITKRLYRERRRLVIIAIITFLGGFIAYFNRDTVVFGLPFPILAGLAFMFVLTTFLMALVVLFPKIRHCAEAAVLSVPVLSLMGAFGSSSDGGLSTPTSVFGLLFCYLTLSVYGGAWVDRYLPCRPKQLSSSATSKLQSQELWPYLTVTPDTFEDFGSEDTLSMEWIEPGVKFRQICRSGDLAKIEEIHTIEVIEPHERYRFFFEVPDATESASISRGSKELHLIPKGNGTRIETIREFDRVSIRAQIFNWIDDAMGRVDDDILLSSEEAHRE